MIFSKHWGGSSLNASRVEAMPRAEAAQIRTVVFFSFKYSARCLGRTNMPLGIICIVALFFRVR